MKAEQLLAFLSAKITADAFEKQISNELFEWKRALKEKGRAAHIQLEEGVTNCDVTTSHVKHLLSSLLDGKLSGEAAYYVVEAILLGENFSTDAATIDVLELLSEEGVAGQVTEQSARSALSTIGD